MGESRTEIRARLEHVLRELFTKELSEADWFRVTEYTRELARILRSRSVDSMENLCLGLERVGQYRIARTWQEDAQTKKRSLGREKIAPPSPKTKDLLNRTLHSLTHLRLESEAGGKSQNGYS